MKNSLILCIIVFVLLMIGAYFLNSVETGEELLPTKAKIALGIFFSLSIVCLIYSMVFLASLNPAETLRRIKKDLMEEAETSGKTWMHDDLRKYIQTETFLKAAEKNSAILNHGLCFSHSEKEWEIAWFNAVEGLNLPCLKMILSGYKKDSGKRDLLNLQTNPEMETAAHLVARSLFANYVYSKGKELCISRQEEILDWLKEMGANIKILNKEGC